MNVPNKTVEIVCSECGQTLMYVDEKSKPQRDMFPHHCPKHSLFGVIEELENKLKMKDATISDLQGALDVKGRADPHKEYVVGRPSSAMECVMSVLRTAQATDVGHGLPSAVIKRRLKDEEELDIKADGSLGRMLCELRYLGFTERLRLPVAFENHGGTWQWVIVPTLGADVKMRKKHVWWITPAGLKYLTDHILPDGIRAVTQKMIDEENERGGAHG